MLLGACGGKDGSFQLGDEARIQADPESVVFTDVPRGESAYQIVTLRHVGTSGTIILDPITLKTSSPDLEIGLVEKRQLTPGEETRIKVVYNSDHDGADEGKLIIGHNIAGNPQTVIPVSTPGQRASLVANPGSVDFGIVQEGAPETVSVRIINTGSADATLTGWSVNEDDVDKDFSVELETGTVIAPGTDTTVDLVYRPTGRNADAAVVTITTERTDVTLQIPVEGQEETPKLVVEPNIVQMSWVEPGESKVVSVKMRNEGNVDLEVYDYGLEDEVAALFLAGGPPPPLTLAPGDGIEVGVLFSPVEELPMGTSPIGRLAVLSNDGAYPTSSSGQCPGTADACTRAEIPVFGAAGIPNIVVVPEDTVDFGYVAEGFTGARSVTVLNVGDQAVTVTEAGLTEQTTEEFSFANPDALPKSLNPGDSVDLKLHFENTGGAVGTEFAQFVLQSDDPLVPQYPLDVVARRAERPTCEPAFVPELLAMGAVRAGDTVTGKLTVVNYGSGNCEYREFDLDSCLKIQSGVRHRYDCQVPGLMNPFEVVSAPTYGTVMGPGQTLTFEVAFTGPEVENLELGRDSYDGRLAALLHDPNTNGFQYVAPPGGWMKGTNLRAESAIPKVTVSPPEVDYGLVRTDCESSPNLVTITNTGPLDAVIENLEALGCGGQVALAHPALPFTVPGFTTVYVETTISPDGPGDTSCDLHLVTDAYITNYDNAQEATIPAKAFGIDVSHQIDTFTQVPPPKVDVLFVVDDSGSMADEQILLKQELPNLVQLATQWGQDYHIAVTTTDTMQKKGVFQGYPTIGTNQDSVADIANNLVVGTTGYWEEMGLQAAWLALSGINAADSDISCVDVPGQCPKYDANHFMWCLSDEATADTCTTPEAGCYCRGPNWGFERDDAELVIIIVSDEEDSSPQSISWYVSQFTALKPKNAPVGVKLHAIVTTEEDCFAGFGTVGYRYQQAVNALDGVLTSICASDFSKQFEEIGDKTFGLKDRFYPTLPADAATLQVTVNGVACTEGWSWNDAAKSVVFEEDGPCWPDYGDEVALEYDVLCSSPTPQN